LWLPSDLDDARCWLDASDSSTITLSGSSITLWEDKIGSNDADDAVDTSNEKITTARPTLALAEQNGLNAIAFNGSQWFDHGSAKGLMRNRSCAMMAMVYKWGTTVGTQAIWSNRTRPNFQQRFVYVLFNGQALIQISRDSDSTQVAVLAVSATPPVHTNWNIAIIFYDYASDLVSMYINGFNIASRSILGLSGQNTDDTDLTNTSSNNSLSIGAGARDGSIARVSNGSRIGELVCGAKTSGSYSQNEREQLEGYLAHKWGLVANLPADHPYKNRFPTR
jgi:hypothetical protein